MTLDGKTVGVPYTYYQWGIYFNRTLYDQVGAEVPSTWDEFIANCAKFKEAGIDCVTTGTKAVAGRRHLRLPQPPHQRLRVPHGARQRRGPLDR